MSDIVLDWADGQPVSRRFGDVYFSRDGGLAETRHVFLDGNRLSARFAALPEHAVFTIGETGFGTGLNFLAAWQLFETTAPARCRLHFVSTEIDPLSATELASALALWPELRPWAQPLLAQYGALPPAWHRFQFRGGRIVLTLLVGDARETLPRLDARVDAWFLDGFSPARNPELWSDALFRAMSQASRDGTTVATYSSAGAVRRGLEAAGFRMDKIAGFGRKREMLRGTFVSTARGGSVAPWLRRPAPLASRPRTAIVIGAGLAGTAAAASLARRGVDVTLVEREDHVAAGASGNPQGMLYINPSAHGTVLTQLLLGGLGFTLRELAAHLPDDATAWSRCGVLALAHDAEEALRQQALAALGWPTGFSRVVDRAEAGALAGVPLPTGGLFYDGGWVHPPALCAALARHDRIDVRPAHGALALDHDDGIWHVRTAHGATLCADLVVVAAAGDTRTLGPTAALPLKPIRGQLTFVDANAASGALRTVVCGESYVAPARAGRHCIGATFDVADDAVDLRPDDHRRNLDRLAQLVPVLHAAFDGDRVDPATLGGRASVRWVTPDYLPLAGAVCDSAVFARRYAALARDATTHFDDVAPWLPGLYVTTGHGSRGLVTAPLLGEVIAALAFDEPAPLPVDVMRALAPTRFDARRLARSGRPPQPS